MSWRPPDWVLLSLMAATGLYLVVYVCWKLCARLQRRWRARVEPPKLPPAPIRPPTVAPATPPAAPPRTAPVPTAEATSQVLGADVCWRVPCEVEPGESLLCILHIKDSAQRFDYPPLVTGEATFAIPQVLPPITTEPMPWAFAENRQGRVVVVEPAQAKALAGRLYFVGDLHGDVDALRAIAERIFREDAAAKLVFLGDLFDRGREHLACARLLFYLARRFPGQVLWLMGNHDQALHYDAAQARFTSDVDPAEFCAWLNANPQAHAEARALIEQIAALPVALILGDHWVSHGGVPNEDLCGAFISLAAMTPTMLEDCVWARMKDAPAKLPNRSHRGAEEGYRNAVAWAKTLAERYGWTIRHLVCAHQHEYREGAGYLPFRRYFGEKAAAPRLTCQCICSFREPDRGGQPVYLRYLGNRTSQPYLCPVPEMPKVWIDASERKRE